jgi:hypothetical protein
VLPLTTAPEPENAANLCENEFLVAVFYTPDLQKVVANGTSVGLMTGDRSRHEWYERTPFEPENILGRLRMVVRIIIRDSRLSVSYLSRL